MDCPSEEQMIRMKVDGVKGIHNPDFNISERQLTVHHEVGILEVISEKLDVDFRNYKILGACNPPFAYKAQQAEEQIGLIQPCNMIVYENESGQTVVATVDPAASMQAVDNPGMGEIAQTIQDKLSKVIERL